MLRPSSCGLASGLTRRGKHSDRSNGHPPIRISTNPRRGDNGFPDDRRSTFVCTGASLDESNAPWTFVGDHTLGR
jgi:hypothetical protein